jgi:drug/metabolite transporter (DMT)-like permease
MSNPDGSLPRERPALTHARALAAAHAAALLFGFAGLFGRWLALAPVFIVLGRTVVAAVALAIVRARLGGARSPLDVKLAANGAILALHWVSFFAAIQAAGVAIGLLGFASFPLFTLILERVFLGRRWTAREAATALVVAGGLALLVPEPSLANRTVQGLAWGILSGFTFALLAVRNRGLAAQRSAADLAFGQNLWAALVLLPLALAEWGTAGVLGVREIALLLVLGLVCTALAHTLFIASLAHLTAHTAATIAALEPVYGIALAALLMGEMPGPRTLAGGVLIVGAAIAVSRGAGAGVGSAQANR